MIESICPNCQRVRHTKGLALRLRCPKCKKNGVNINDVPLTRESNCPSCGEARTTSGHNEPRAHCHKCKNTMMDQTGENNPFYGRHHSEESKSKIGKYIKSDAQREQARNSLRLQGNRRGPYDIWVEKYGREVADAKQAESSARKSINAAGSKNPMYGKPAPIGSGGGWSGWYQGHYFRSLLELAYLKKLLDSGVQFVNGECAKYAISYQLDGVGRTYFCDFVLVDSNQFVEIKPQRLTATAINVSKFAAAQAKHGDNFIVLSEADVGVLSTEVIAELYKTHDLKWTSNWEKRYHENFDPRAPRGR